ncbi:E3 ubiquitin-protein ligase SINA-like 5 isoform X2 [Eutrema salsugineum]|uniref:E3 ubiquitin-protein ligase SINA-like 5 isoform X2 n=1 Tax=Eutrema salsugineum TaxID=72664 RepID=UPI000CED7C6D|nr:E3 ubiquitin-protein ligase SINA-like 5 isoform X2 [Eutrema salsugineum]
MFSIVPLATSHSRDQSIRLDIGDIRCRALEIVLEASIVPCRNTVHGCTETTSYDTQSKHEKVCIFVRCSCPLPNCSYIGSYTDVESHTRSVHSWDSDNFIPFVLDSPQIFSMNLRKQKTTVFQEEKKGDLIVVQAFKGSDGVYMTVSSISPLTPGLPNFSCSLAKLNSYTTLRLGLMVKKIQKVEEQLEKPDVSFMLIPTYMLSGDHLKLQICIGREYKYVHI